MGLTERQRQFIANNTSEGPPNLKPMYTSPNLNSNLALQIAIIKFYFPRIVSFAFLASATAAASSVCVGRGTRNIRLPTGLCYDVITIEHIHICNMDDQDVYVT